MNNELSYSLKEYLISQSIARHHYPIRYWAKNKSLFIHLSFWLWAIWIFMSLFSIFLPVSNQQKLGRGAIIVFETVFQYIVRILESHKEVLPETQESANISPPIWNYEAYLFMYLTAIILIVGGYCIYLIRHFLEDIGAILRKYNAPKITRLKFSIFYYWSKFLWVFCIFLTVWTAFALLYMRKPTGQYAETFIYSSTNIDQTTEGKEYHRSLTVTGWITAGLNIFSFINILVLYMKYAREVFKGNALFFADLRSKEEFSPDIFVDPEISKNIKLSRYLSGKREYTHLNTPGYICELENVNKYFYVKDGIFHALKNVNLNIEDGDFVVILGYSGSGKTTLLNLLSGIDRPTEGKCIISNCDTTKMNDYDLNLFRRKKIGYIFQNYALLPNLTASENIAIAQGMDKPSFIDFVKARWTQYQALSKDINRMDFLFKCLKDLFFSKTSKEELENIISILNLSEHRNKYPHTLSGGQQQRVAIARALIKKPSILLADEPTGAVDHAMTKSILTLFYNINEHAKTTVILITHNPLIAQMAKRVLHVANGEIIRDVKNSKPLHPSDIKGL